MTERGRGEMERSTDSFRVAGSSLHWRDGQLRIDLDERSVPHLTPVRGSVTVTPERVAPRSFALDDAGRHVWRPIAPLARVAVDLDRPDMRWQGHGYLDSNQGTEPLEKGFRRWDWSRARFGNSAFVLYDAERRGGQKQSLALRFDADGAVTSVPGPPETPLPTGFWGVRRATRADAPDKTAIRRVLEDSPFYTREILETSLLGEPMEAVHESLDLDRFANPIVRLMLPFRMPRITGRRA